MALNSLFVLMCLPLRNYSLCSASVNQHSGWSVVLSCLSTGSLSVLTKLVVQSNQLMTLPRQIGSVCTHDVV